MQLSPQSFAAVTDFFHQSSGIRLSADKLALVQGRLQRLAAERGDRDLDSYVRQVLSGSDPAEQVRLVDRLTTNETYFFREPQHFAFLAGLLAKRSASQPFRVWSAASSSGEEAYSIAMVLHDRLGDAAWEVVGTDLSTAMVDAARQALYPVSRGQNMPEYYRKQYCLKGEGAYEGQMLIHRKLRERVRFETANLLEPLPALGEFDVIFLRNVLIYFDTDSKREIVLQLLPLLKPGAHLFSGHAESLGHLNLPVRPVQAAVYQHA